MTQMQMIPAIRELYLHLLDDFAAHNADPDRLSTYEISVEEYEYLCQIRSADDLMNYDFNNEQMRALAWDAARALGLSDHDAAGVAGDI